MSIFEKRKELLVLATVIVLGTVWLWGSSENSQEDTKQSTAVTVIANDIELQPITDPIIKPGHNVSAKTLPTLSVDEGMQHEMQRVADIYEQRSKYAPYSLYLSAEQTDLINPNQSHESPRAYDIDGHNVSILIKPKNYRFSLGEIITADIQIKSSVQGLDAITKLTVEVMARDKKAHWPMKKRMDIEQKGQRTLLAEFDPSAELEPMSDAEYSIIVKVEFNGESPVIQSAPIKIVESIAKITGLGRQRIEGNDLIIPINIEADKSGYYQVSGSLFDAPSNSAISFIIAKQRLSSGSNTLDAKVQGLVLRDKGFSGPFRLQGITLVKKSERPGMAEEFGLAADSYSVDKVDLNDFESIPYENPMTEQRLEFMRSIGQ